MNNRIKELTEQAKSFARAQMSHALNPMLFSADVFQQKFAELVAMECLEQCTVISREHHALATTDSAADGEGPDPYEYGLYMGTIKCRVAIKKHLGVK